MLASYRHAPRRVPGRKIIAREGAIAQNQRAREALAVRQSKNSAKRQGSSAARRTACQACPGRGETGWKAGLRSPFCFPLDAATLPSLAAVARASRYEELMSARIANRRAAAAVGRPRQSRRCNDFSDEMSSSGWRVPLQADPRPLRPGPGASLGCHVANGKVAQFIARRSWGVLGDFKAILVKGERGGRGKDTSSSLESKLRWSEEALALDILPCLSCKHGVTA